MLDAALMILFGAAALCFGLGQRLAARVLGLIAVAATLLAALLALVGPPPPDAANPLVVFTLGAVDLSFWPALPLSGRALALGLLGAGGASLLALLGAISPGVQGFGALFGWALLTLAGALLSLGSPTLSLAQPLAWAVLAQSSYGLLRASGAGDSLDSSLPFGLSSGLVASVLLTGGLLATGGHRAVDELPPGPVALLGLVAVLALVAAPPLVLARREATEVPAPLGLLIYGLAAPAAGLGWLLRVVNELPILPQTWAVVLGLVGGLGSLACAAGALAQPRLRSLVLWVTAGQAATVIAAAGLSDPFAILAGPGLLLALLLGTIPGAVAVMALERTAGDDDYRVPGAVPPRAAAFAWLVWLLVVLGLPPFWGLWPRLWLIQAAQFNQPWLAVLLIAGTGLTALALFAPLGRLWGEAAPTTSSGWPEWLPTLLVGVPLLLLGLVPDLAWGLWLSQLRFAPSQLPTSTGLAFAVVGAGLVLLGVVIALARSQVSRPSLRDPDEAVTYLAPEALGSLLTPLSWLAAPGPLLSLLWTAGLRVSQGLRLVISLFEQRYYLLGVLGALIVIMLLMAQ
ncbi:MAG: hypothetical protein AB4911_16875 [Oscillochloridaceae bacterium umkhey_bin13]